MRNTPPVSREEVRVSVGLPPDCCVNLVDRNAFSILAQGLRVSRQHIGLPEDPEFVICQDEHVRSAMDTSISMKRSKGAEQRWRYNTDAFQPRSPDRRSGAGSVSDRPVCFQRLEPSPTAGRSRRTSAETFSATVKPALQRHRGGPGSKRGPSAAVNIWCAAQKG